MDTHSSLDLLRYILISNTQAGISHTYKAISDHNYLTRNQNVFHFSCFKLLKKKNHSHLTMKHTFVAENLKIIRRGRLFE